MKIIFTDTNEKLYKKVKQAIKYFPIYAIEVAREDITVFCEKGYVICSASNPNWFGDFLKLGVMVIFVQGKVKIFGKKGKFLGEYSQEEIFGK